MIRCSATARLAFVSLTTLLVVGCQTNSLVMNDLEPRSFEVPEAWTAVNVDEPGSADESAPPTIEAETRLESNWWANFELDQLDALIDEALLASPDLEAAARRIEAAIAQIGVAAAAGRPQLSASLDASRQRLQIVANSFRFTDHNAVLSASWELDIWGRIRAGRESALADAEALEAEFYGAQLSLCGQVARVLFDVMQLQQQLEFDEVDLASAEAISTRIEERFGAGLRNALDLRLTRADLERARELVANRRDQLNVATRSLEVLIGRYPRGSLQANSVLPELGPAPQSLPSTLVERRPDLVRAERAVAAALRRTDEATRARLPRLTLSASGGSSDIEFENIFNKDFGVWSIAAGIAGPIYQGGELLARQEIAEVRAAETTATYVSAALSAFAEVESAMASETHLAERESALGRTAEELRASLEISESRYFAGLLDILDFLETRRRYYDSERALAQVRADRLRRRVDLYVALGGGFDRTDIASIDRETEENDD